MGDWIPGPGPTDGDDDYFGDDTDETVSGGLGDDHLRGFAGNDTLYGGDGLDELWGWQGNDILYGEDGDDELVGGDGHDIMYGGAGDDWLRNQSSSGPNDDAFFGGDGNDDFIFGVTDVVGITGVITIDGGDGYDVLQSTHVSSQITFSPGSSILGVEALYLRGQFTLDPSLLSSIHSIWGNGGALIMRESGVLDLSAHNMPASFTYNSSSVLTSTISAASLSIIGASGNDTITVPNDAGARVFIFGREGNDVLTGGGANDILAGEQGDDTVHGGGGNDEIGLFGGGIDLIFGDAGNDTFYFRGDNYPNYVPVPVNTPLVATVDGGDGDDALIITEGVIGAGTSFIGIETTTISYVGQGPITMAPGTLPTTGTLISADARLVHSSGGTTDFSAMDIPMALGRLMSFTGSSGADVFIWSPTSEVRLLANGGAGSDLLRGGAGNDELNGGGGVFDDTLTGGAGDDTFVFGPASGDDTIVDFVAGGTDDELDLSAYTTAGITWTITQVGADTVFDFTNGDSITLLNTTATSLVQLDPDSYG